MRSSPGPEGTKRVHSGSRVRAFRGGKRVCITGARGCPAPGSRELSALKERDRISISLRKVQAAGGQRMRRRGQDESGSQTAGQSSRQGQARRAEQGWAADICKGGSAGFGESRGWGVK